MSLYFALMPRFISLVYSPWSEKARWALDHHQIDYEPVSYQPVLGELPLRVKMRQFRGIISVPVMETQTGWLTDSWDIARWAEEHGQGSPLFAPNEDRIAEYNQLSERGLAAARAVGLRRIMGNDDWLRALVPRKIGAALGPLAPHIARFAVRRTLNKFGAMDRPTEEHQETLRRLLDEVRDGLGGKARGHLVGDELSYADIAVAQVLLFIAPENLGGFRLSAAGRDGYRDPVLVDEYSDLVEWRNWLYETYR